jgi:hypothetical protein
MGSTPYSDYDDGVLQSTVLEYCGLHNWQVPERIYATSHTIVRRLYDESPSRAFLLFHARMCERSAHPELHTWAESVRLSGK